MPFALALLLAAAVPPAAPVVAPEEESFAAAEDRALRLTVPVFANGQGPFDFTLDTGADRSVVSDRLARALALPPGRPVLVHGVVDVRPVATVRLARLRVGRIERRDLATPVLPADALGATGFLGIDALGRHEVVLDFRRRRVTLARSGPRTADPPDTIVVTGRSRFGQLILTDARIAGRKVYAIIDTGAQNTVGNMALHRLLLGGAPFAPGDGRLLGVTGGSIPAESGVISRVRLGGLTISNMPVAYAAAHSFAKFKVEDAPALLVGMDVLRGFAEVRLDFPRREARFVLPGTAAP